MKLVLCMYQLCTFLIRRPFPLQTQKIIRRRGAYGIYVGQKVEWGSMNQIAVAQDRDRWQVLVNAVMNLQVSDNAENFSTS